ncbi:MAG: efflux RND transporter permease subunit [Myxococcota bacterium]
MIALSGIALLNGMVLVICLNPLRHEERAIEDISVEGACRRLRPVPKTAPITSLGLIPMLLSRGTGSGVQRPLATVGFESLVTSAALTQLVIPALYGWCAGARRRERSPDLSQAGTKP